MKVYSRPLTKGEKKKKVIDDHVIYIRTSDNKAFKITESVKGELTIFLPDEKSVMAIQPSGPRRFVIKQFRGWVS